MPITKTINFLPAVYRNPYDCAFVYISFQGVWWSSTEYDNMNEWVRNVDTSAYASRTVADKRNGLSVRLIKD